PNIPSLGLAWNRTDHLLSSGAVRRESPRQSQARVCGLRPFRHSIAFAFCSSILMVPYPITAASRKRIEDHDPLHYDTAAGLNVMPGDPLALLADQKRDDIRNVVRLSQPTQTG